MSTLLIYFNFTIFTLINASCRNKGPESYIGSWALSEDVEWFEEEQVVIRNSNLISHEQGTNGSRSEEELLLRCGECNSGLYSNN